MSRYSSIPLATRNRYKGDIYMLASDRVWRENLLREARHFEDAAERAAERGDWDKADEYCAKASELVAKAFAPPIAASMKANRKHREAVDAGGRE